MKKNETKTEFPYLINNQIINGKIYDELMNLEYEISVIFLKICNLYFIGSDRIILLLKPDIVNNNKIGYTNEGNKYSKQRFIK